MRLALALLVLSTGTATAQTVIATRTIRAQEVIPPEAVRLDPARTPNAYSALSQVVGQEAQVAIYPGRPVLHGSLGAPALVERNQLVEISFSRGALTITAEGRALGRGSAGDRIRVMNLSSKTTFFGTVTPQGTVTVSSE